MQAHHQHFVESIRVKHNRGMTEATDITTRTSTVTMFSRGTYLKMMSVGTPSHSRWRLTCKVAQIRLKSGDYRKTASDQKRGKLRTCAQYQPSSVVYVLAAQAPRFRKHNHPIQQKISKSNHDLPLLVMGPALRVKLPHRQSSQQRPPHGLHMKYPNHYMLADACKWHDLTQVKVNTSLL